METSGYDMSDVEGNIRVLTQKMELIQDLDKQIGDLKEWLPFWAQFERIHKDISIENEDKFQYLVQSTVPKSRARLLVESYPHTSENYPKAIESLRSRFGREDVLIEVYVRELLKLILNNLNSKMKVTHLYDQIESRLRSLETLVWQRSNNYDTEFSLKLRLEKLMEFLRKEVENEEKFR
ncbi:hypothetical protein NQ317_010339 [Molorchus minor]|uniref:Uncharacterized protein n=1 Tax=Molorchus minor TaxID=1323400 RepID=A0ABQ9IQ51_9CUCU|nr:hypothetical protein NQ317_010339 [Molorchus minor]